MPETHQTHPPVPTDPVGCFWACTRPEAGDTDVTCYYPPCYYCMLAAHAVIMNEPTATVDNMQSRETVSMRKMLEKAVNELGYVFPPFPEATNA